MEWRTKVLGARSLTASILSSTYVVFKKKFGNSSTSLLLSRNRLGKITCEDKVSKAWENYQCHGIPSHWLKDYSLTKFSQIKENLFCNISQPKAEIVLETFFLQKIGQYCPPRARTHSTHIPKRVVSLQKNGVLSNYILHSSMSCIILLNSMNMKLYGCCKLTITYCSFVSILVRFALSFKVRRFTWR